MKKKRKIKKSSFCSFLSNQHLILKIIFILLSFVLTFIANKAHFIVLSFVTAMLLGFCLKIYMVWLKIVVRMIPLFISLYIFVIILPVDFWNKTVLIIKIIYLALLSAYLIKTTSMNKAAEDLHPFTKYPFFNKMFLFIIMTVSFIPILMDKLSELGKGKSLESCLGDTLTYSKKIYESMEYDVDGILDDGKNHDFWIFPNLYLMFYIVVVFLLAVS